MEYPDLEIEDYENVPIAYSEVQKLLDAFVTVGLTSVVDAHTVHAAECGVDYYKRQIVDILAANPPLMSLPTYINENEDDYLWYSDFYDDIPKELFIEYGRFSFPVVTITPSNYATELEKVTWPYFKEIVRLVILIRLVEHIAPVPDEPQPFVPMKKGSLPSPTRSYDPKMSEGQYRLVTECMNTLEVFRNPITTSQLAELLSGKQPRLFKVTNQKRLTYLFDELAGLGLIKRSWIAVAGYNCDFASVQPRWSEQKHGEKLHHITSQQFTNCRRLNKIQAIDGLNTIDEMVERL